MPHKNDRPRLSALENAVMQVVWERQRLTSDEVRSALRRAHDLKDSTVRTILTGCCTMPLRVRSTGGSLSASCFMAAWTRCCLKMECCPLWTTVHFRQQELSRSQRFRKVPRRGPDVDGFRIECVRSTGTPVH